MTEKERLDVSGQMMHRHQWPAERDRQRLGEGDPHEQRSDQTRPLGHGNRVEMRPAYPAITQGPLDHTADVAQMLTRGELRHHAAPLAMDLHLGGDDAGTDLPGRRPRLAFDCHRRGGLVAGGLDAK